MSGAVTVIEPSLRVPPDRGVRPLGAQLATVLLAICAVIPATLFVWTGFASQPAAASAYDGVEQNNVIEPFDRNLAAEAERVGTYVSIDHAVTVVERFAHMINLGDTVEVLELMAPKQFHTLPAQWPHLPTDGRWWTSGELDANQVRDFVRYVFTIPGSVVLSDCGGERTGSAAEFIVVTCTYAATGGPLEALGQGPELGVMRATLAGGRIAGISRTGSIDLSLWERLAEWAVTTDPHRYSAVFGVVDSQPTLDPIYSGNSALDHLSAATEMASHLHERRIFTNVRRFVVSSTT